MTQKLIVSVDASREHPDMTVQDVFAHVLELFQLVNESDPEIQGKVRWRLVKATMNSPFTVVAEAVAAVPGVRIEHAAKQQKRAFRRNISELRAGRMPSAWSTPKARETVSRVLARNRDGLGTTKIDEGLKSERPVVITQDDAAIAAIVAAANQAPQQRTKQQVGSIEGSLVEVGTHYQQPAILVIERKTKQEVWCVVPQAFQHQISEHTSVEDVWKGSRVIVRGTIHFNLDGKFARVVATDVRRVDPQHVSDDAIADKNFTGGLSVVEYLNRLREGALG